MKVTTLYFLFLLCVLIDMVFWLLQLICRAIESICIDCSLYMGKIKRGIINKYNEYVTTQTESKKVKSEETLPPPHNPISIVGGSKTSFIKELPVLRKPEEEEIKPFKSEPLEVTIEDSNDFDDEPDSFDVESDSKISDDELDDFEYPDSDDEDMNNSSGVSFEELSETISILSEKAPSEIEQEKAVNVLDAISNTELFQFIVINNSVYENAKMLMNAFNRNRETPEGDFNINDLIE